LLTLVCTLHSMIMVWNHTVIKKGAKGPLNIGPHF